MGNFSIDLRQSKKIVDSEEALIKKLASIERNITSVRAGLNLGAATDRVKARLSELVSDVSEERNSMKDMKKGLDDISQKYTKTEKDLLGISPSEVISGIVGVMAMPQIMLSGWALQLLGLNNEDKDNLLTKLINDGIGNSGLPFWDVFGFHAEDDDFFGIKSDEVIDLIHDSNLSDTNPLKKYADKLHDIDEKGKKDIIKGYYDEDDIWHDSTGAPEGSDAQKDFDKHKPFEPDVTLASVGTSVSGALWETGAEGSYGIASGSYNVAAGQAEASASAYAGPLGVGAEVGIGVTAFTASAQGSLGNEYFNLHGNGEVNVGKADASAAVNVGLLDKDGNFNPQLGAKFSAEALAAEASATVGGTVAGTEINAKGSVNVGVGFHADVGINDGVLSFDVGASLGVGVGVSLEIDFSGTVNAVADFASNAWSGIMGLFG